MGLGFGLLSAQIRPGETDWTRAYDETVRLAVEAERLGFDYAWRYLGVLGGTNFFTVNLGW